MANKYHGGILAGSTNITRRVNLRPLTGITPIAGNLLAWYWRQGAAAPVQINPVTILLNAAWTDSGWVAVSTANMPGLYRFDIPNAAFAAGAEFVEIWVSAESAGGVYVDCQTISLISEADFLASQAVATRTEVDANSADLNAIIAALVGIAADGDNIDANVATLLARLTAPRAANLDFLTADVATIGGNVTLLTARLTALRAAALDFLDVAISSRSAGDPWATALPGAYVAGQAGYILGTNIPAGNGANAVLLQVVDTGSAGVPGVLITIKNDALTSLPIAWGITNEDGELSVNLNDGAYKIIVISGPRFELLEPVALVVAGNPPAPIEIELTEHDVEPPASPDLCRVVARVLNADGSPAVGVNFTFTLLSTGTIETGQPDPQTADTFISLLTFTEPTKANGVMEKDVIRSDFVQPHNASTVQWQITCAALGINITRTLNQDTLDLGVLLPL
jgi:hypothetical protein